MNDTPYFEAELTDGTTTIRGTAFDGIAMIAIEPNNGPLHQMTIRLNTRQLEEMANICDQLRYVLIETRERDAA